MEKNVTERTWKKLQKSKDFVFQGTSVNTGGGMDPDTGIFTCPIGGLYMFVFHVATHDNKKALLSIRLNGEEVASVFDQNHKDNHKNSMAGTNILLRWATTL